jgi:hypothetical protein
MATNGSIKRIRKTAKQRDQLDLARQVLTAQLRDACRQAQSEGVPITDIAREARLSRQGVYDLIDRQPS